MATIKVKFRPSAVNGKAGAVCYQLCHRQENKQITTSMRIFPHWWNPQKRELITTPDNAATLIGRYEKWLAQRNVRRNSSSFYMRILRAAYNKAVREKLTEQSYPFAQVYTGIAPTPKRAVSEETILQLQRLNLSGHPSLLLARDLFIFSYCTRGMAFVDMAYLKDTAHRALHPHHPGTLPARPPRQSLHLPRHHVRRPRTGLPAVPDRTELPQPEAETAGRARQRDAPPLLLHLAP